MVFIKTTTNRGVDCIIKDNFKYRMHRKMSSGDISWRCTEKKCVATLQTNAEMSEIVCLRDIHDHGNKSARVIESHVLRNNCKRKACEELTSEPSKIIRAELCRSASYKIQKNDMTNFRLSLYRARRRQIPTYPRTAKEALEQLNSLDILTNTDKSSAVLPVLKGLPVQQNEGFITSEPVPITSEPVPSTSTAPCETVVTDESMEKEALTSIKYEEVFMSEDEEKEIASGFHDYTPTALTDVTDASAGLQDPLPIMHTSEITEPKTETVTNPTEVYSVRHERNEAPSSVDSAPDVNELFAKYLVAELRSLHPDDAALLRKKIHCLVADFMISGTGSRAAKV